MDGVTDQVKLEPTHLAAIRRWNAERGEMPIACRTTICDRIDLRRLRFGQSHTKLVVAASAFSVGNLVPERQNGVFISQPEPRMS